MIRRVGFLVALVWLAGLSLAQGQEGHQWGLEERPVPREGNGLPQGSLFPPPFDQLVPFLSGFGGDVDQLRSQGDARGLMEAALLLYKAESILGRQSPLISASDLLREATTMARDQRDPGALQKAVEIWGAPGLDGDGEDLARGYLEEVEKEKTDMMPRRRCVVIFHNRTDRPSLSLYINRKPAGTLAPGEIREMSGLVAGNQHLEAFDDSLTWGPRRVFVGPGEVFHWKLFD